MCSLSGANTGRPRRSLRITASATSINGTASTKIGMRTGMAKAATSAPCGWRVRPTPAIVAAASSSPRSMDPESPMKIRAG